MRTSCMADVLQVTTSPRRAALELRLPTETPAHGALIFTLAEYVMGSSMTGGNTLLDVGNAIAENGAGAFHATK